MGRSGLCDLGVVVEYEGEHHQLERPQYRSDVGRYVAIVGTPTTMLQVAKVARTRVGRYREFLWELVDPATTVQLARFSGMDACSPTLEPVLEDYVRLRPLGASRRSGFPCLVNLCNSLHG